MNIPVFDENDELLSNCQFQDNLTQENVPDYVNLNCRIGLTKYPGRRYHGFYVLMYYDTHYPDRSYGEIISKNEAYLECIKRGHEEVIEELGIIYEREREVI